MHVLAVLDAACKAMTSFSFEPPGTAACKWVFARLHLPPQVEHDAPDNVDAARVQLTELVNDVLLDPGFLRSIPVLLGMQCECAWRQLVALLLPSDESLTASKRCCNSFCSEAMRVQLSHGGPHLWHSREHAIVRHLIGASSVDEISQGPLQ